MKVVVALLAMCGTAAASPCQLLGLESKALQPTASVSDEGGIVIGETPTPEVYQGPPLRLARDKWKVKVAGKAVDAKEDKIAPGLVVYRPPAKATAYELVDAAGKKVAAATVMTKLPDLLEAPAVSRVTSGVTNSRHPSQFVNVELSATPPKGALVLVVQKLKGPALSWGKPFDTEKLVNVFTTGGGCIGKFPDGFTQAAPGDLVTAFWVDANGRRSRVSQQIVVEKGRGD